MIGLLYYKYIEWKYGVVFNGESDFAIFLATIEYIAYMLMILLFVVGGK